MSLSPIDSPIYGVKTAGPSSIHTSSDVLVSVVLTGCTASKESRDAATPFPERCKSALAGLRYAFEGLSENRSVAAEVVPMSVEVSSATTGQSRMLSAQGWQQEHQANAPKADCT